MRLALLLAMLALLGCATPHFTGSNTVRCDEGGRWTRATDPTTFADTESFECQKGLTRTGTISPQAAGITLNAIQGAIEGARRAAP